MQSRYLILIFSIIIAVILIYSSVFIVDERQKALVVQFGEPKKVNTDPGLKFKIPFIQNVIFFEKRILNISAKTKEVIAADQKRLIVDAFAKYKIIDPLLFYQSLRNEYIANDRLNTIIDSSLRQVLGSVPFDQLLSGGRSGIMEKIQYIVNDEAKSFGIQIVDVRIRRADLPTENSEAIYRQMQTERETEAKEFRAEGFEQAQRIRSLADKESRILIADAKKQADILRGEGDAEATKIYAKSFGLDKDFFEFYRTMQAYSQTFNKENTSFVLTPDSEFLKYFGKKITTVE